MIQSWRCCRRASANPRAFTFAAGIDAYVAAHLKDFPGDITTTPEPDGGMSVRFSFPVGPRLGVR